VGVVLSYEAGARDSRMGLRLGRQSLVLIGQVGLGWSETSLISVV
jgi:hypothetical protein